MGAENLIIELGSKAVACFSDRYFGVYYGSRDSYGLVKAKTGVVFATGSRPGFPLFKNNDMMGCTFVDKALNMNMKAKKDKATGKEIKKRVVVVGYSFHALVAAGEMANRG